MQKAEVPYEALGSGMTEQDKDGAIESIGGGWGTVLAARLGETRSRSLGEFLSDAWAGKAPVYPCRSHVFAAFDATPLSSVRAVILGQDPYPTEGQACGLAFAVPVGVDRPLSLRHIVSKIEEDLSCQVPAQATLETWARNGALLLNTSLTVEAGKSNSHRGRWRSFTQAVLEVLAEQPRQIVFLLWGADARNKRRRRLIDNGRHIILESAHPAARLSATNPDSFACSHPFRNTKDLVDWTLD